MCVCVCVCVLGGGGVKRIGIWFLKVSYAGKKKRNLGFKKINCGRVR